MQESSSFSARIRTGVDHLNEAARSFTQALKLPTGKMRNHTVSQNQTPAAAAASHATHETAQPRISSLTESFSSESVSSQSSFEKLKGRFSLKKPNFQESKVNKLYTESLSSDSSASSKAPDLKPSLLGGLTPTQMNSLKESLPENQRAQAKERLGVTLPVAGQRDKLTLDSAESPAKIPPCPAKAN